MSPWAAVSFVVGAAGYMVVIKASYMLYRSTPPELIKGQLPVLKHGEATDYFTAAERSADERRELAHRGFRLLVLGATLQLMGHLIGGIGAWAAG